MKTKILSLALMSLWSFTSLFAQDRTTVTANNPDISDNLDLRAVASIFGDSRDLSDFERRLNDPNSQISNLDLNGDNRVDYLRVIETVEGNVHLIIIQSVLGRDNYQDVATVEVERDRYNRVQVQVVGDVYMYGNNYIYEPVYAYTPVIYTSFWAGNYHPYYSSWYWGYYPSFYVAWSPFPIYTYYNHIGTFINFSHHYNYVDNRRCSVAYNNYYYNGRRGNYYERQYPARSFSSRNTGYTNRYELDNSRRTQTANSTNQIPTSGFRNNTNAAGSPRNIRVNDNSNGSAPRTYSNTRSPESPRSVATQSPKTSGNTRSTESPRSVATQSSSTYGNTRSTESPRSVAAQSPRSYGNQSELPRTYGNSGNTISSELPRTYGNPTSQESPRSQYGPGSESSPRSYGNQRSAGSSVNSSPREFSQQRGSSQGSAATRGSGNRRS